MHAGDEDPGFPYYSHELRLGSVSQAQCRFKPRWGGEGRGGRKNKVKNEPPSAAVDCRFFFLHHLEQARIRAMLSASPCANHGTRRHRHGRPWRRGSRAWP